MNKILITGINGFTGFHLEKHFLQLGFDVYGTVMDIPKYKNHFQCDITSIEDVNNVISSLIPDFIIHTAAISFVEESNASLIYNVNVIGTENILKSLIKYSISPKKIIIASSATVYGNEGYTTLDETMCPNPINHYGTSKLAMEYIVSNYYNILNIIIVRPFNYTGIGQKNHFLIPKIVEHFKNKKELIELGNLHVAREFNHINFVVDVYSQLLKNNKKSIILNICSNKPIKLLDIITHMNKIAGYEITVKVNSKLVRKNEISSLSGSTKRLNEVVHVKNEYSLESLLKEMYETV